MRDPNPLLGDSNSPRPRSPLRVDAWLVEPDACRISRGEDSARLEPKVMDLLMYLAERPEQVVSREELEQAIWTGTVVGYDALTSAIIKLRKALNDDSRHPRIIETVAKRGYRLIAPVTAPQTDSAGQPAVATSLVLPLRRVSLIAIVAAVVVVAIGWFAVDRFWVRSHVVPSIAVLPFANLSGDPKFEYFSDGITEDITTDLSKISGLLVIARNSAFAYKGEPIALKKVAEGLGVRYVLEGSVRRSSNELRITAKLIDTESGTHLWTERYDRHLQDLFSVQDDVTQKIVTALALNLTDKERTRVARRYTRSVEAYDLLLQGQSYYARSTRDDNAQARELYRRAIALDPEFARAHAALALTHTEDFRYGWSRDPAASMSLALSLARRAVALDDSIPQTYWALGYVYVFNKQYNKAVSAAERAIALDPNNADAHVTLAFGRVYQGRSQEAITLMNRAMRLNPHYPSQYPSILGRAYYHLGEYAKAVEILRHATEMNAARLAPRLYLILSYVALGKLDDAKWEANEILMHNHGFTVATVDQVLPVGDAAVLTRIQNDLRRAGLN